MLLLFKEGFWALRGTDYYLGSTRLCQRRSRVSMIMIADEMHGRGYYVKVYLGNIIISLTSRYAASAPPA